MRRVVSATVLAVLAVGAPPARPSTTDGQLLWKLIEHPEAADFTQPGASQAKYFTSPVAVQAGKTYTIVIFGEADEKSPGTGTSYSYDGVWQYDYRPSSAQPNPQRCCIDMQIAGHEGHPVRPGESPAQLVPFEPKTHYYKVRFTPSDSGNLEARDVMRYAQGYTTITGQITFELYSGSAAPSGGGGSKLPPLSSPTATPKLNVPTDYKVMALGSLGIFDGWPPRGGVYEEDTEIHFVGADGSYVAGPPLAAVQDQASNAGTICVLFATALGDSSSEEAMAQAEGRFASCADTVARILARADQIKKLGGGRPRAHAAASRCPTAVRGTKGARPRLRITCTVTATGARISIRPRAKGKTLAQVLHGHAPKLVVARSSIPAGNPARLRVKWTAKKR